MLGVHNSMLPSHLDKFMWREIHGYERPHKSIQQLYLPRVAVVPRWFTI